MSGSEREVRDYPRTLHRHAKENRRFEVGKWRKDSACFPIFFFYLILSFQVQACLDAGDDPNAPDPRGRTALHAAAAAGAFKTCKLLLRGGGARCDARDSRGETPLLSAAQGGHRAVVELLAAAGADVAAADEGGVTALHAAASLGQDECLRAVVRSDGTKKKKFNVLPIEEQFKSLRTAQLQEQKNSSYGISEVHCSSLIVLNVCSPLSLNRLSRDLQAPEKDEANPTYLYCAVGNRKKKKKKEGRRRGLGISSEGLAFLNGKTEEGMAALHLAASEGYKWGNMLQNILLNMEN